MLEHLLRRCCVQAWRHETAGNIIVFLIAGIFGGQLTATAGNVEIKFVVKTDQVKKELLDSTRRPLRREQFTSSTRKTFLFSSNPTRASS